MPAPAASLVKVPVLVELFHRVEQVATRLDAPLLLLDNAAHLLMADLARFVRSRLAGTTR